MIICHEWMFFSPCRNKKWLNLSCPTPIQWVLARNYPPPPPPPPWGGGDARAPQRTAPGNKSLWPEILKTPHPTRKAPGAPTGHRLPIQREREGRKAHTKRPREDGGGGKQGTGWVGRMKPGVGHCATCTVALASLYVRHAYRQSLASRSGPCERGTFKCRFGNGVTYVGLRHKNEAKDLAGHPK